MRPEDSETTLLDLARTPGIGEPFPVNNPRLQGIRCARVRRWRKHLIFYRPVVGGIEVIRVLHGARELSKLLEEAEDE